MAACRNLNIRIIAECIPATTTGSLHVYPPIPPHPEPCLQSCSIESDRSTTAATDWFIRDMQRRSHEIILQNDLILWMAFYSCDQRRRVFFRSEKIVQRILACFPEFIASNPQSFKKEMHFPRRPKRMGESNQTEIIKQRRKGRSKKARNSHPGIGGAIGFSPSSTTVKGKNGPPGKTISIFSGGI